MGLAKRMAGHAIIAIALTLLTQIGGVAWLAARAFRRPFPAFLLIYAALLGLAHLTAPVFGRVALPCFGERVAAQSPLYCALARNFATPTARDGLTTLAEAMRTQSPAAKVLYLDAGFPFLNGFPLLPHLSHRDGRKVDLAFFYRDAGGVYLPGKTRSPIGYWAFEAPRGEGACAARSDLITLRWDFDWAQDWFTDRPMDPDLTGAMVRWLAVEGPRHGVKRMLLEPHLKARFAPGADIIRFQGCRAARHDDHIHLEFGG